MLGGLLGVGRLCMEIQLNLITVALGNGQYRTARQEAVPGGSSWRQYVLCMLTFEGCWYGRASVAIW